MKKIIISCILILPFVLLVLNQYKYTIVTASDGQEYGFYETRNSYEIQKADFLPQIEFFDYDKDGVPDEKRISGIAIRTPYTASVPISNEEKQIFREVISKTKCKK